MTTTQPYEFVVNFTGQAPIQPKKDKIQRTRTGCMTCRKRKRKCDEQKPGCSWCSSRGIKCIWPSDVEKSPRTTFKLIHYTPIKLLHDDQSTAQAQTPLSRLDEQPIPPEPHIPIVPLDASTAAEDIAIEAQVSRRRSSVFMTTTKSVDGTCGLQDVNENSTFNPFDFFGQVLHTNQMLLPTQRDKFMSAAINGFIISIGPQCTHPLLTTSATFTPVIQTNGLLKMIAESCGSSYLSWSNPDLLEFSYQKCTKAFGALESFVQCNGFQQKDEVWLTCACQLMTLCSKVTWGCDRLMGNKSLKLSYEIIKRKMTRLSKESSTRTCGSKRKAMPRPMEPSSIQDEFENDLITNDSLKMDIENAMIGYSEASDQWRQFERMFIESFIYNYSVSVLITPPEEGFPNPFEVFRETRRYLKTPLFNCEVSWMNNPVIGASFDAYELAAKASYLIRHISEPWVHTCACKMLEMTTYYPRPILHQDVRHDSKYQELKDSVLASELVMAASKMILRKIIEPSLREDDPLVQKEVKLAIHKLKTLSPVGMIRGILPWAHFVIGLACIDEEDRTCIVQSCYLSAELVHGRHLYSIIDSLEVSWGRQPTSEQFKTDARGLDVLLDIKFLQKMLI